MKTLLATISISALLTTGAIAADIYQPGSLKDGPVTVSAETANWNGLWIGAFAGAEFSNNVLGYSQDYAYSLEGDYAAHAGLSLDGLGSAGAFGELQIGYDRHISQSLVLGIFGGLNISSGEFEAKLDAHDSEGAAVAANLTFSQKWGGVVGPRFGYAHGDSLFYLAGGWAFGEMERVKASLSVNGQSVSGDLFADQETDLSGYFAEIGLEHKFTPSLSLKAAGRYTDYGAIDLHKAGESGRGYSESEKLDLDRDTLSAMVGIVYRH